MEEKRTWINATTLGDLIDMKADLHPDKEAIVFRDERHTYSDIAHKSAQISKSLLALGVEPGDRIGYFLGESVETVLIMLGAAKIGAICAPINSRFKPRELRQVIVHAGMKVVFTTASDSGTDFNDLIQRTFPQIAESESSSLSLEDAPELQTVVVMDDIERPGTVNLTELDRLADIVSDEEVLFRQSGVRVRETAIIMYTSGTTAMPKGAMLSHEAFSRYGISLQERMLLNEDDKIWSALPMFHIGGVAFMLASIFVGGTYFHTGHFDPGVALAQIRDERCTVALPAFETIWLPIISHQDRSDNDLASLRTLMCVGVPERLREFQKATPDAPLLNACGQTEACAFLGLSELNDDPELRFTKGGFPMPGLEIEVHDPETEEALPFGSVGELWYRGPAMFDGYFRDEELNEKVFDERGFFRTGDICEIDLDGRVTFISRLKDMLKVGGENVAAAEVEGYLLTHPAVAMAQVVAAPDERYVEVPAAYIQLNSGAEVTEAEIIDFCRDEIATFRIPRYVRFVDDWPMSGTKIQKFALRERIAEELKDKGIKSAEKMSSSKD